MSSGSTAQDIQKTYEVLFKVELVAPFISKSTGAMSFGLDEFMQGSPGRLKLNGRLIKGNIRHQLNTFINILKSCDADANELASIVDSFFGPSGESEENLSDSQARGRLEFPWQLEQVNDQTEEDDQAQESAFKLRPFDEKRYRIKICPETGKVEKGHLLVIQTHYPTGTIVPFEGKGYFHGTDDEQKSLEKWLQAAKSQIKALGAYKSVGFGQINDFEITVSPVKDQEADKNRLSEVDHEIGFWNLIFKSDRPICCAKPRVRTSNAFESENHIPGNVIKAALINSPQYQQLKKRGDSLLVKHIDDLIVRHALPQAKTKVGKKHNWQRSKATPQSLLKLGNQYINMALKDPYSLIKKSSKHSEVVQYLAGEYQTDWKGDLSDKPLLDLIGNQDYWPKKILSVHTAINSELGTAAKSQLYSFESIDHQDNQWLGQLGLSSKAYKQLSNESLKTFTQELMDVLGQGVTQVGKTKARLQLAKVVPHTLSEVIYADQKDGKSYIAIKLESSAQLFTKAELAAYKNELTSCYKGYFEKDNVFKFERHYTDQQLVGGDYLHHKFSADPKKELYNFEVLVSPGSVFVLSFNDKDKTDVKERIQSWLRDGLPECDSGINWQTTPYIPQNGYAEISLMNEELAKFGTDIPGIVIEAENG